MTLRSLDEVQLAVGMLVPVVIKATQTMLINEQVEAELKQTRTWLDWNHKSLCVRPSYP